MRKFCITPSAPLLLLLAVSALSTQSQAQTFVQDRIAKSIDASSMERLPDSIHPLAKRALDQGMADNSKVLHGMGISFNRTGAQEAALQAMLKAQQDKTSPSYHKWLTPTQFGQQFGMSRADLDKVTGWLQQQGFTITTVAQSNNAIGFSGSVASVEKAFQTQIHNYSLNGEIHFANATAISLPASLAGAVSSVRGLDDFRLKPRVRFMQKTAAARKAHYTSGVGGSHFVAPGDFSVIYDLNPLYSAGNTGAGITIAVVGQTDILVSDITDFRAAAGLTVNNPTVVTVPGTVPTSVVTGAASDDLAETDLDLEWSGGVAPGASVVLVNSDNVFTSLQYAIANTINGISVPIISMSYGACEAGYQSSTLTSFEGFLAQANAQGQTLVLAAGDVGAADCDESDNPQQPDISATQGLAVDYPGSSVYVTDAGGSEFMGDGTAASPQTGAGQYWSANGSGSTSDDVVTSAISYIPEMVWNDTTVSLGNGGGFDAGGGGVSALWKKPSWQAGVPGIPADGFRDVPDISLDASNYHDPYLYCTQMFTDGSPSTYVSSCQANSFRVSDPGQQDDQAFISLAGGTSFSAPSFAGILAVIEQKIASGGGLGNINPALYTMASNATTYASAFHDITTGNNQVPCTTGFPNCPAGTNQVIGYSAAAGYDQATGIGSIDANNLATSFAALVAATGTKTALVATHRERLWPSGSRSPSAASVTPNTLSSAPTGTVTFTVDGVAQTPVPLSSAGPPFTASLTTSFLDRRFARGLRHLFRGFHLHSFDQQQRNGDRCFAGYASNHDRGDRKPHHRRAGQQHYPDCHHNRHYRRHTERAGHLYHWGRDHRHREAGDVEQQQHGDGNGHCSRHRIARLRGRD